MPTETASAPTVVEFEQEIDIQAPADAVYEGMLHRLSLGNKAQEDQPMPLELERRPGGRWYRSLGKDVGHLWGFVQSIRPPELIEIFGPMFMSYPVSGHLIIRFLPIENGTRLTFKYGAFGLLLEEHVVGIQAGWKTLLADVKSRAEG